MRKTLIALSSALLFAAAYASYAAGPPPMAFPQQAPTVTQITDLFSGSDDYLKKDGTTGTLAGGGDMAKATYDADEDSHVDDAELLKVKSVAGYVQAVGVTAGNTREKTVRDANDTILELGGSYTPTGAWDFTSLTGTWPTFNQNTTGTAAALGANGANCAAGQLPLGVDASGAAEGCTATPSLQALTLTGENTISLGTSSTTTGSVIFKNASNANAFTVTSGVSGAAIGWTLPTAAPGGANYLLNVDADGTMGYTDPASLGGSGDVVAADDSQTWGTGTGPVVWTFGVTGTDPTISVATGGFTVSADLLPSASAGKNLGSGTYPWDYIYTNKIVVTASTDPGSTYTDSNTDATGTGFVYVNATTEGQDSQFNIYVDDSAGEKTKYVEVDGVSETVDILKPLTGASGKFTGELSGLMPSVVVALSSGVHDGDNDAATMTDAGIDLGADTLIGMTVYNITDGSSCTITDNAETTITCTLAGGTDNNWDTNDVWQVGPGPSQSGSMYYVAGATTIRHPATAGYAACYVADGQNKLTIDMASDTMVFTGTLDTAVTTLDAGDSIDSSDTTTDDFICLHNKSATAVKGLGKRGTWSDGGAS